MVLEGTGRPLELHERPDPVPAPGEIRVVVAACGVCRTDLHVIDGELANIRLPIIPGHEIVGRIDQLGAGVAGLAIGQRVGVPWLGSACGVCPYCRSARENLCDRPEFTGYTRDGGFATHALADARFVVPLDDATSDVEEAPLLCAGLIGWRALVKAGDAARLGIYGFGAAAHIISQIARAEGRRIFVFTRPGDGAAQDFARRLGAEWAAGSDEPAPEPLDAAIIFAAVGALVPIALRAVAKGGRVVCAGIHMSDIPSFAYAALWASVRSCRSPISQGEMPGRFFARRATRTFTPKPLPMRCRTPIRRFMMCGAGASKARPCWCHERQLHVGESACLRATR
jgi:propanol-preferring alcohol dehydrogenase